MSRHTLEPRNNHLADSQLEIAIGWDPPLYTYFVQVLDLAREEEDPGFEVLWRGTTPGEIPSPDTTIALVTPWAVVPAGLRATLIADRATS